MSAKDEITYITKSGLLKSQRNLLFNKSNKYPMIIVLS